MKKLSLIVLMSSMFVLSAINPCNAQTVSTFENLTLGSSSYWDGSLMPMGTTFTSGNAIFPNLFDTSFGGYWSSGWAYSNVQDSTTAGFMNTFGARPAIGANASTNYIIGQPGAIINLAPAAIGKVVSGFYITNGTFAALSMKDGDGFSKKFGGTSGDDPDWFKLTVNAWNNGTLINDSVTFYLADYRFSNNAEDYIITDWQWVDLSTLGNVDSLSFHLSSTDNGSFGMNTPAFFCVDDFTTTDSPMGISDSEISSHMTRIYPNPVNDILQIEMPQQQEAFIKITDINGRILVEETLYKNAHSINVSSLDKGFYFISINSSEGMVTYKLIKK